MEWRRGHVIGRGSSATVYSATSSHTDHVFAVKSTELTNSQFLQREQKILSNLKSPYIVGYIGHDITREDDKFVYNLFMEYVPGGTLSDKIRKNGRLGENLIACYTRQILLGLDYLHSINIAHCDIKGQNILIGENGAKVADFGCAKWQGHTADVAVPFGGTPMFMAPEVACGEQQGVPADVWALGCTVIEMATGAAPWPGQTDPVSVMYKIAYSKESPEIPDYLSSKGKDFLNKCFKRDATERWTVKQLLDHPFLAEIEYCFNSISYFNSPTSILDQAVWNSIPDPKTLSGMTKVDSGDEPFERIGGLVSSRATWTREENWIIVRQQS